MIRISQHRHNLDTRAHEALQPRTTLAQAFDDWLGRREREQQAKTESEPGPETAAQAQASPPGPQAAEQEEPATPAGPETPTPAAAASSQAHLRMSLPLAPQAQAWVFDLSASNLPVQSLTLTRNGQGRLSLAIQASGMASSQQMESHLPRLKQRLADKVTHVDWQDDGFLSARDDGSIDP